MRRRTLTREEKSLWAHVQRTVSPFAGRAMIEILDPPDLTDPPVRVPARGAAPRPTPKASVAAPPFAPPLAPMDRRMKRKVKRGLREIEGALDLHGMSQAAAYAALSRFLHQKQRAGASLVIVITGKGGAGPGVDPERERGVLRRMAPHWLRLPDLRPLILGFETAAPHHGGDGALYVRLRRIGAPREHEP